MGLCRDRHALEGKFSAQVNKIVSRTRILILVTSVISRARIVPGSHSRPDAEDLN